jgi:hypothetical protein
MVSITRCDGSEITESQDAARKIVSGINTVYGIVYAMPDFIDIDPGLPYCSYGTTASYLPV